MIRTLVMSLSLAVGAMTLMTACTNASSVCQTVCECEHCNKYAEDSVCRSMEKEEASAEAYGCGDQYAAVLTCALDKGRCDEEQANYTTQGPGKCVQQSLGMSCTVDTDCFAVDATCSAGMCLELACEGSGQPCATASDCADSGPDLCQKEQEALATCIGKASALID